MLQEARRLFTMRIAGDENAISPHLRWEVFVIVVAHKGRAKAEALLSLWKTSSNSDERYLALECPGAPVTPHWSSGFLDSFLQKISRSRCTSEPTTYNTRLPPSPGIHPHQLTIVYLAQIYLLLWLMGSSAHGATELWEWAKLNWGRVEESLPASM